MAPSSVTEHRSFTATRGSDRRSASAVAVRTVRTRALRNAAISVATRRRIRRAAPPPAVRSMPPLARPPRCGSSPPARRRRSRRRCARSPTSPPSAARSRQRPTRRLRATWSSVWPISSTAATEASVALRKPAICSEISLVALAVCAASVFTSPATTAKPLPASPARAASIVAFSASRLVSAGNLGDQPHHGADASGRLGQRRDRIARAAALRCGSARHLAGMPDLCRDFVERRRQLLAGRGDDLSVAHRLVRRAGHVALRWR